MKKLQSTISLLLLLIAATSQAQDKEYLRTAKLCEMVAADYSKLAMTFSDMWLKTEQPGSGVRPLDIMKLRQQEEDSLYASAIESRKNYRSPEALMAHYQTENFMKQGIVLAYDLAESMPGKEKIYYQRRIEVECRAEAARNFLESNRR